MSEKFYDQVRVFKIVDDKFDASHTGATRIQQLRLVCALYPSRAEVWAGHLTTWAWRRGESGFFGWLGCRADAVESWTRRARARWHFIRRTSPWPVEVEEQTE